MSASCGASPANTPRPSSVPATAPLATARVTTDDIVPEILEAGLYVQGHDRLVLDDENGWALAGGQGHRQGCMHHGWSRTLRVFSLCASGRTRRSASFLARVRG